MTPLPGHKAEDMDSGNMRYDSGFKKKRRGPVVFGKSFGRFAI
jgi:hypothetical protein